MQARLEGIIGRFGADTGTIHLVEDGILVLKAHAGVPPPSGADRRQGPGWLRVWPGWPRSETSQFSSCNIQVDRRQRLPRIANCYDLKSRS
jgi:hypothetical protein